MIKFDLNSIDSSADWASKNVGVSAYGEGYLNSDLSKIESLATIYCTGETKYLSGVGDISVNIKFNTAPTSSNDFDYQIRYMGENGNYVIDKNFVAGWLDGMYSMPFKLTVPANTDIFIWSDQNYYYTNYVLNNDGAVYFGCEYIKLKLKANDILTLYAIHCVICLSPNTKILMADKTEKEIYKLSKGDKILSYNPATMKIEEDEITYTDSQETKVAGSYDIYTFDDGTKIETINRHRFYNYEQQKMVYMDEWLIGDHAVTKDGKLTKLISHIYVPRETRHYTLFTKNQNYFANGLLSGNRNTKELKIKI